VGGNRVRARYLLVIWRDWALDSRMRFPGRFLLLSGMVVLACRPMAMLSQTRSASLVRDGFVVMNEVATEQWPAMLARVNPPSNMEMLNPGQCVRAAVAANGDGHEHFFDQASVGWTVRMGGKEESFPFAPTYATRQMKPEEGDEVPGALQTHSLKRTVGSSSMSVAVSAAKWCVPQGATDQTAEVRITVKREGQETALRPAAIQIESLATAAKKTFTDKQELGEFMQSYHLSPEPGRLLPALEYLVASKEQSAIPFTFFKTAFQHDAATVAGFGPGLAAMNKATRLFGMGLIAKAGVKLAEPPTLTDEEKKWMAEAPDLPDGYDMKPDQELAAKLDYLWAEFGATGRLRPVRAVVNALAWRADYDAYDKIRRAGKSPGKLTDSLMRGLCYKAAGWSLSSFNQTDPVAADYVDAIVADPATPAALRDELTHLQMNAAFER
jgi:hypothetical protein